VPSLFHVSDAAPLAVMRPRPSPPGTPHVVGVRWGETSTGRPLVWAVDEEHLVNYLLPREFPRVDDCFAAVADAGAELRVTASLWPYVDALLEGGGEFSAIRMRNAVPRQP